MPPRETDPIFAHVNESQMQAIVYEGKHLLIVAGPGTGKTHTLTRRIAWRTTKAGTGEQHCLAVTFTNKAAAEMKDRLDAFGKDVSSKVFIGTIHGFCLAMLREYTEAAGLSHSFEIASPEEIDIFAHEVWPEATAAERRARLDELSRIKSCIMDAPVPDTVRLYDEQLLSHGLIDFDTILQKTYNVLCTHSEILEALRQRYPFIFIDEYQDINGIQHALVRLIAGTSGSVTAIGDPHQSIYGFRGSDLRFLNPSSPISPARRCLR